MATIDGTIRCGDKPTIRASAAGYVSQERAVTATGPWGAYASFELLKLRFE